MKNLTFVLFLFCVACVSLSKEDAPTPPKPAPVPVPKEDISGIFTNTNESSKNDTNTTTILNTTTTVTTVAAPTTKLVPVDLPKKGSAEEEHHSSFTIFFILILVALSILTTHMLIQTRFHYLPESIADILLGAFAGLVLKMSGSVQNTEAFNPTVFFIVLLPPIIFESGYNLHKGNFFQNLGSILVFAIIGTVISALVVGGGIYLLGQAQVVYKLTWIESFAFGSLISAVDPVATLAIFHALDVEPVLYMLVFGESVLNDAVSIVLTTTVLEYADPSIKVTNKAEAVFSAAGRFLAMFFGSAAIGVLCGLISALLLKHVDLRKTPSLEFGLMLTFSYLPYALAEGIHLSGIMAILFCGIVMSHYTHPNLSPVTQITTQQTFRTIAFIAETCVFAYLGLAFFSFKLMVKPAFVIWSIALVLLGRAFNIFPLSFIMNYFREHKITRNNQFIMWFSGLRGAIAFALSLHLEFEQEKRYVLVTATLIIVLFTIFFLGGMTLPLMKCLKANKKKKKSEREVSLSKTKEMGETVDTDHLSELTEEEYEVGYVRSHQKGFMKVDAKYLIPFFTRRFTKQEVKEGRTQINHLATQWYQDVRAVASESDSEDEAETSLINHAEVNHH
ncbi:sodium/hydrogen exchanger 8-like isoform X2 [Ostrea edulis]|uniref:sodium/hydrogen exchanger 8-like isoform X2 n=1 Tax=Ostrea edulis TaxID=37623 RepID=UPI0024AF924B|nr:sodium/hydrogen exchanger 8-like isoform X2 [Ostrea edulis]